MSRTLKVVLTGGGSAGHVLPAVPVLRLLRERGHSLAFIGGADEHYLAAEDVPFHRISAGKLRRYFSWRNLVDGFRVLLGVWQSFRLFGSLQPDVIFSKGGFVSFPVVFAGWLRRTPVVAHESDASPGLANRLAMPFLTALGVSFPMPRPHRLRGELVHTGSPIRPELLAGDASRGRALVAAGPDTPLVLATGGSLGAARLNDMLRAAAPELSQDCCLVHICGPGKAAPLDLPGYHAFEFVNEGWGDLLAAADVVVSRAGSNALFELLTLGKPHLLIPLPRRASRGDQLENAAWSEGAGYSLVLQEEELDPPRLVAAVRQILAERALWRARLSAFVAPDASRRLADMIEAAARP